MTASLYRKYNTFSDRENEQQRRTMTFAELPNHYNYGSQQACGKSVNKL